MPAIVGAINVNAVNGVFNVGDVGTIAPTTYSKTYAGGGSFNSGDTLNINNLPSVINVYGSEAFEQLNVSRRQSDQGVREEDKRK
ncbi:spore germination protein [Paenibacillus doosanensis]|uniref:Spore germination protein GerPA n=1 Tax=Paenibacillus konkukensis TaxID=2020716 RepID=A0ABY4RIB2_9BACL|nr:MULTISPECIES: spore germination protein [Paenibacillus]MCS7464407.1 spore germination protein [Paenibacillus doosanensis]UQZ82161.1 putative spore germination protein GerPA [Paenibacillus konkukensis]